MNLSDLNRETPGNFQVTQAAILRVEEASTSGLKANWKLSQVKRMKAQKELVVGSLDDIGDVNGPIYPCDINDGQCTMECPAFGADCPKGEVKKEEKKDENIQVSDSRTGSTSSNKRTNSKRSGRKKSKR